MNKDFLKAIFIRAAKTWCQAFLAVTGVTGAGRSIAEIDWVNALSVATAAFIISVVWNIMTGLPETDQLGGEMTEQEAYEALEENPELRAEVQEYEEGEDE